MSKISRKIFCAVMIIAALTVTIYALDGQKTIEDYYDQGLLNPTQVTTPNGTVVSAWTFESDFQDPAKEASKAAQQARYA